MENKELDLNIPIELKQKMIDIMTNNPTLVKIGENEWAIRGLSMYSMQKIYKIGISLKQTEDGRHYDNILEAILHDMEAIAEIVAIILCNSYFDCEFENKFQLKQMETRNEDMISMMKTKVLLCSKTDDVPDWHSIIMTVFSELYIEPLFQLTLLVKATSTSATMRSMRVAEQLQSWQQAQ